MAKSKQVRIYIEISSEEYLSYYSGSAKNVLSTASDGRLIKFPANILRKFVTLDGVKGAFQIEFDEKNKLVSIERVGD